MIAWLLLFSLCVYPVKADIGLTSAGTFTCQQDGDVHFRPRGPSLADGSVWIMYAESNGYPCQQETLVDGIRIYGCQTVRLCPLNVFIRDNGLLHLLGVSCSREVAAGCLSPWHVDKKSRRELKDIQQVGNQDFILTTTNVAFSVKLEFNSNDEIEIDCSSGGPNTMYVSNPEPEVLRSAIAFSEETRSRCQVTFLDLGLGVVVEQCNLYDPVVVAFSSREDHIGVIGGNVAFFRAYRIDCALYRAKENINIDDININVRAGGRGMMACTVTWAIFTVLAIVVKLLL